MKTVKKIFDILSNLVLCVVCVFLLLVAPMLIGYKPVMVLSGSMEPEFNVGSVIYYKDTAFENIQVGDPITFYMGDGGALVTHRVVEKDELSHEFITKGDANNSRDTSPVAYDRVVGKALEFCIPYAGYFTVFCRQIPVIVTLGAILLFNAVLDYFVPDEKRETENKEEGAIGE